METKQGNIIATEAGYYKNGAIIIRWSSDKGFFGNITMVQDKKAPYHIKIDPEMLDISTVLEIIKVWVNQGMSHTHPEEKTED